MNTMAPAASVSLNYVYSLDEWAEELKLEADHARAIALVHQLDISRIHEPGRSDPLQDPVAMLLTLNQGARLIQEHNAWCAARFQPLIERLLQNQSDFYSFLETPKIREALCLEILVQGMGKAWDLRSLGVRDPTVLPTKESPWSTALLQEMVKWATEQGKLTAPVTICAGPRALEDLLKELGEQSGACRNGILLCKQEPGGAGGLEDVGHVMPIWIEKQDGKIYILLLDSVSELFDKPLPFPSVKNGKIFQCIHFVRESVERVLPEAQIFGARSGQLRQTDHSSCGFFALHDLCWIDQQRRSGEDLWSSFCRWDSSEEKRSLPVGIAKLAQRQWETVREMAGVDLESLQKQAAKYSIAYTKVGDSQSEIEPIRSNGTTVLKILKMMRALCQKKEPA